jgi:hypothetical protein
MSQFNKNNYNNIALMVNLATIVINIFANFHPILLTILPLVNYP